MEGFRPVARFFMGANTPQGFVGFPEELYSAGEGWQVFLIKGGPGCGKSTLMRSLAHRMEEVGQETEEIRCSSDPRSLDGVIFRATGMPWKRCFRWTGVSARRRWRPIGRP